jgi:predicted nicotinamide N-methyase
MLRAARRKGVAYRRGSVDARPEPEGDEVIEETVALGPWPVDLVRPRDSDALIDERAFEHEEYLPYWADLWPSALVMARDVARRSLRGARVLELGCGLGLVSIAAARSGARVLATDWAPDAVAFTGENARRNGVRLDVLRADWGAPGALLDRAPWDLVLASDVLYERRTVELLLPLLPRLVEPAGQVWIADPGRVPAERFLAEAEKSWERRTSEEGTSPAVRLHRLRRLG